MNYDRGALECDFAETYQIYDMRQLTPGKAAVFASGLRDDSRIKLLMSGQKVSFSDLLLARATDILALLLWTKCKEGTPRPASIAEILVPGPLIYEECDSVESFESRRKAIMEGGI